MVKTIQIKIGLKSFDDEVEIVVVCLISHTDSAYLGVMVVLLVSHEFKPSGISDFEE